MRAQGEVGRANEVADVLDDEHIDGRQVELLQRPLQHEGIEVTLAAGVDLHRRGPGGRGAVGVNAGGDVAINDGQAQLAGQPADGLLDQAGLACAGRGQEVEAEDAGGVQAGAVVGRQAVVGAQDSFDDGDSVGPGVSV